MVQTADPPCRNKHEFKARTMVLYCLACTAQGDSLAQTANAQSSHFGTVYKKKVQSLIVQQTAPIVFCFILYPSMNILQIYSKVYYLRMSPRAFQRVLLPMHCFGKCSHDHNGVEMWQTTSAHAPTNVNAKIMQ